MAIPRAIFGLAAALVALGSLTGRLRAAADFSALPPDQTAALEAAIVAEMQKQNAVGVAIGVIRRNQVVFVKCYGHDDVARRVPLTADTLLRWGACFHPLTAITALQLVEKGKLELDADVRQYVPEFPYKGYPLTVRHLLAQQSGIPAIRKGETVIETELPTVATRTFEDPVAALAKFKESPLTSKPGEKFESSSYAYLLLSAVVQRAGKEPFAVQVQKRIAAPLGLTSLQLDQPWVELPHRVRGLRLDEQKRIIPSVLSDVSWKSGGGGYVSTIGDFTKVTLALLTGDLLKRESLELMRKPQGASDSSGYSYGFGLWVGKYGSGNWPKYVQFSREPKGRARLELFPEDRSAVAVMTNCEWVDPIPFKALVYATLKK